MHRLFSTRAAAAAAPRPVAAAAAGGAGTLQALARMARTPILFEPQGATKVATFARDHLGIPPGQKCIVVSTASSAKRAAIITHFLRRGGYLPLQCELPDRAPLESSVAQVMEAARRTGSTFLAAYGGSATLSVGKAAAALLANGGSVAEYAPELGGRRLLTKPSLPLITVPSCPSGGELSREAHILMKGQALGSLVAHPASVQGAVVDPALATSLQGGPALAAGYAAFVHCVEGLLRPDSDAHARGLAFEGAQRAALSLGCVLSDPGNVAHRGQLALASLVASALMTQGPLGASRGLGLAVAGRYNVPYTVAVSAVAPSLLALSLDAALQRYEESGGCASGSSDEDNDDDSDAPSGDGPRRLVDESEALVPAGKAMARVLAKAVAEDRAAEAEGAGDPHVDALLAPYQAAAGEADMDLSALGGGGRQGSPGSHPGGGGDDEATATLVRFTRLAGVMRRGVERGRAAVAVATRAGGGSASSSSSSGSAAPPPAIPPFTLEHLGADWRSLDGGNGPGAAGDPEGDLTAFGELMTALREVGLPLNVPAPCLEDLSLTQLDLQAVADAAEVDPNTMAHVVPLRRSDLLEALRDS